MYTCFYGIGFVRIVITEHCIDKEVKYLVACREVLELRGQISMQTWVIVPLPAEIKRELPPADILQGAVPDHKRECM